MTGEYIQAQLDNIGCIVGGTFGLVDEAGLVLFCTDPALKDTTLFAEDGALSNISLGSECFEVGGYLFHQVILHSCRMNFLFARISSDATDAERKNTERMLELSCYALSGQEMNNDKHEASLILRVITHEESEAELAELNALLGDKIAHANTLRLILVLLKNTENDSDASLVSGMLENIFPADQGYFTATIKAGIAQTKRVYVLTIAEADEEGRIEELFSLADQIKNTIVGETMLDVDVAMSGDFSDISNLGTAYKEAMEAQRIGSSFGENKPCYRYDAIGLERLISSLDADRSRKFVEETFGVEFLKDKASRELLDTMDVFLNTNQNISEAARTLYIHRNTMIYRLDKFTKLTGLDYGNFNTATRIRLAMMIIKYTEAVKRHE